MHGRASRRADRHRLAQRGAVRRGNQGGLKQSGDRRSEGRHAAGASCGNRRARVPGVDEGHGQGDPRRPRQHDRARHCRAAPRHAR